MFFLELKTSRHSLHWNGHPGMNWELVSCVAILIEDGIINHFNPFHVSALFFDHGTHG